MVRSSVEEARHALPPPNERSMEARRPALPSTSIASALPRERVRSPADVWSAMDSVRNDRFWWRVHQSLSREAGVFGLRVQIKDSNAKSPTQSGLRLGMKRQVFTTSSQLIR